MWRVWDTTELLLPPGKRFEVLVRGPPAGTYRLRALPYDQGAMDQRAAVPVATIASRGTPRPPARLPSALVPTGDLRGRPVAASRTEVLADPTGPGAAYTINGKAYDPNRIDVRATIGTIERWTIVNASSEQHPFHMHTDYFQVVSLNGHSYGARSLQDTVNVPADGRAVILVQFEDFTGKLVFHCHIMAHSDRGMMGTVLVTRGRRGG